MFIGLIMLTAAWGVTQNGWVICYAWSLFFYGIGVGKFSREPQTSSFQFGPDKMIPQVVNIQ